MRIAFFTNNYKPFVGGVPIAIELLADRLRRRGHRVYIFAPEYEEETEDEPDVFRSFSLKNFNRSSFSLPIPNLEPYRRFGELQVEVVHVHHPFLLGQTGMFLARSENLPLVFTYHTQYEKYAHYLPFDEKVVEEVAVKLSTRFANCCDAVIAPSSDIKSMLLERGVSVPIRVIPTGVDLGRFRKGRGKLLREQFSIPSEDKVLLFVSRLAKEKNIEFLLECYSKLSAEIANLWFVVVGSGDHEEQLRRKARSTPSPERVIFTGTLQGEELVSAYRGADLFVFASTTETQGMVVLEAMAGGLPVVAVDAPGVRDVVVDGENGFLAPNGDADLFTARCKEVLSNPALYTQLKNGAAEQARHLSLSNTTRKVEQVYRMARHHPHPERQERFLLLREIFRAEFKSFTDSLQEIMP